MLIEVYGDVVCPWCYIGERRLEKALAARPDLNIERVWRPFQLRPEMPVEGENWERFARDKFGGWDNAQASFWQVTQVGQGDGIIFDFAKVASAPNTVNAHRLILWAAERGQSWEMASALFRAYFAEGVNLSRPAELVTVAVALGYEAAEVEAFLNGAAYVAEVEASQQTAHQLGITSVPTYVLDGRYAISGAQPVEVFVRALERAAQPV